MINCYPSVLFVHLLESLYTLNKESTRLFFSYAVNFDLIFCSRSAHNIPAWLHCLTFKCWRKFVFCVMEKIYFCIYNRLLAPLMDSILVEAAHLFYSLFAQFFTGWFSIYTCAQKWLKNRNIMLFCSTDKTSYFLCYSAVLS